MGGAGFTTGNLVVLFAFFFYVTAVVNWGQWPWAGATTQPRTGLAELALMAIPTVAVYAGYLVPIVFTRRYPAIVRARYANQPTPQGDPR